MHEDEILTDNTRISYCEQCEKCKFWGNNGDPFSNKHTKSNCDKYPIPGVKPSFVINNSGNCPYRQEKG